MTNKMWETRRIKERIGFMIPPPWLCECDDTNCREILLGGRHFVHNHHGKGKNNSMKNPDVRNKVSKALKEVWKDVSRRDKASKQKLEYWRTHPEQKIRASIQATEFMNRPNEKDRLSKQMSETNKRMWQSQEYRESIIKQRIDFMNLPEQKDRSSKQLKNLWLNPKYRESMIGVNCPAYGKPTHHSHKSFLHKTPFQNSVLMYNWDDLYAAYLDSIAEPYYYEPCAFPMFIYGKQTTYTPDFYLPRLDTYIEIKGYWRDDSKEKFDKFKELYPNNTIKLLIKKDLEALGIKIRKYKKKQTNIKSLFDF